MHLYLDTEFNSFGGDLISIAIVSAPSHGPALEFYEVQHWFNLDLHPWVKENVIPKLGKASVSREAVRHRLHNFLSAIPSPVIHADWPEDFVHLFGLLAGKDGMGFIRGLRAQYVPQITTQPTNPHNALSDARALMEAMT